ncbi:MAG: hypothetical protein ACJ8C4_20095 [Gemmataceae bacterium]
MRLLSIIIFGLTVFSVAWFATASPTQNIIVQSDAIPAGYESIPFETNTGCLAIPVIIQERLVHVEIDTGSACTVLDPKRVKDIPLTWTRDSAVQGYTDPILKWDAGLTCGTQVIRIGQQSYTGGTIHAFDVSEVNRSLTDRNMKTVDGLIGNDILTKAGAIIDFPRSRLLIRINERGK